MVGCESCCRCCGARRAAARIRVADDDDVRRPGPLRAPLVDASFEEVNEVSKFDRYLPPWEVSSSTLGHHILCNLLVSLLLEVSGRAYDLAFPGQRQLEACYLRSLTAARCPPPVSRAVFASTSIDSRLSSTCDSYSSSVLPSLQKVSRLPLMEHQYATRIPTSAY